MSFLVSQKNWILIQSEWYHFSFIACISLYEIQFTFCYLESRKILDEVFFVVFAWLMQI